VHHVTKSYNSFWYVSPKVSIDARAGDRPLEVVDEDFLEPLPGVDRVVAKALRPYERCRVQSHREVDDLGGVGASCDFYGGR
jgi:hypothetical protein